MHNAAFAAVGLNARYVACDVDPARLGEAVRGLQALGALGANVTIPHKREVARLVDTLSPVARAIGAVNTLVFSKNAAGAAEIVGDNSDVAGFVGPLEPHRDRVEGGSALVLGSGGSSRAVVYGLSQHFAPATVTVAARSRESVLGFMKQFEKRGIVIHPIPFEQATAAAARADLIVNATPVGMHPNADRSPIDGGAASAGQIVYDLVYNPTITTLLADAAAAGATTIGGLEMLLSQAAESFRMWTGLDMDVDVARAVLRVKLGDQRKTDDTENIQL